MQNERVEVRTIGPHDRSQLVVHANPCKEVGVLKWLKHRPVQLSGEVDIARAAIAEAKPQPVMAKDLCGRHPYEVHRVILRQRVDRLRGAAALGTVPVRLQLLAMQAGPLAYEPELRTVLPILRGSSAQQEDEQDDEGGEQRRGRE